MPVLRSQAVPKNGSTFHKSSQSVIPIASSSQEKGTQVSQDDAGNTAQSTLRRSSRLNMIDIAVESLNQRRKVLKINEADDISVISSMGHRGRGRRGCGRKLRGSGRGRVVNVANVSSRLQADDSELHSLPVTVISEDGGESSANPELPEAHPMVDNSTSNNEAIHGLLSDRGKAKEQLAACSSIAASIFDSSDRLHDSILPNSTHGRSERGRGRGRRKVVSVAAVSAHLQADSELHSLSVTVMSEDGGESSAKPELPETSPPVDNSCARNEAIHGSISDNQDATRSRFLAIAKKRAAYFAYFNDEENELASKAKRTGSSSNTALQQSTETPAAEQDWPGPFSTARKLVEGRAAAAAAREEAGKVDTEVSFVDWQPSAFSRDTACLNPILPSLYDLCVKILSANMEHVESLDGVPDSAKNRLSASLCECRKMDGKALVLFFTGDPSQICIPDCSLVTEQELTEMMKKCSANSLEVLELGNCGRGLSDNCLSELVTLSAGSLPVLHTLTLRGAYRLTDNGLNIVKYAPALTSLDLTDCNCFTEFGIQVVVDVAGANLRSLILDGCKQLDCLKLLPSLLKIHQLQKLSLAHMASMTDEIAIELALHLGSGLQELSLAHCSSLTDAALAVIAPCCPELKSLCLDFLSLLTDEGLGSVANYCRSISSLSLNRCKFSDEAISAYVTSSGSLLCELSLNSVQQAANETLMALAQHAKFSLNTFDASWCRLMTDEGFGHLADSCIKLRELTLYGCTQVTEKFLKGHRNDNLRVIGLWKSSGF